VKLVSGPVGLVHGSEISWTRQYTDPSACLTVGDEIEVRVVSIKPEKQELMLGMRQILPNPWDDMPGRYPPGATVSGVVRRLTNYGAFVEIDGGIQGLVHRAGMGTPAAHPGEVVSLGDRVTCVVLGVDAERGRIALKLRGPSDATAPLALPADPAWPPLIPPEVLNWNDGLVVRMARDIREGRAFDEMPVLADALEDAGCVEAVVLAHLRDRGPHARRCWVLDLLLGRG
jgi:predicted RNA-binding protein with RPS1 domain